MKMVILMKVIVLDFEHLILIDINWDIQGMVYQCNSINRDMSINLSLIKKLQKNLKVVEKLNTQILRKI